MKKLPFLIFGVALALLTTNSNFVRGADAASGATPAPTYPPNRISVVSPPYCSDISGDTTISICAPGLKNIVVKCWQQGGEFGSDSTVGTIALDDQSKGSIVFPADKYPHGPITVRITGDVGTKKDYCFLQLYNKGGVSWNEGMPKGPPPQAEGMPLVYADDFKGPLSISSKDPKATYYDHKPGGGDFSTIPFTSYDSPNNPFSQVDTYLRIRADAKKHSSGLICSTKNDNTGITKVGQPCYFECRFLAPDEKGTWPAFWIMNDCSSVQIKGQKPIGPDELDIIEGYGGAPGTYMITTHYWNQGAAGKAQKGVYKPVDMRKLGGDSTWWETFHTYGLKITETDTIYYCDNVEVGRHPTGALSKTCPFYFLINLATGGGWPVDLSRYDGRADMYVDYVRVYGQPAPAK